MYKVVTHVYEMSYTFPINIVLTSGAANRLRPENARKLPVPISFLDDDTPTGKAAVKSLSGLTPDELVLHKAKLSKLRNKRRQDKIALLREIDNLTTNTGKIHYLLRLYNPSIRDMSEAELLNRIDSFLETLHLE